MREDSAFKAREQALRWPANYLRPCRDPHHRRKRLCGFAPALSVARNSALAKRALGDHQQRLDRFLAASD